MDDKKIGRYTGQFMNNQMHGVGCLVLLNPKEERNTIIEAQFVHNKIHGYGRIIFNDGSFQ